MRILIAGASGFIGKNLVSTLKGAGHDLLSLVRDPSQVDGAHFLWDPYASKIDLKAFEGVDVVINLSGENIGKKRWTAKVRQKILESRLHATHTLASAICHLKSPPQLFLQASAVGFYGDRKDQLCTEETPQGEGFLALVCAQWEKGVEPIRDLGIRTVIFRFGTVLSAQGGMLAKIIPLFRCLLGGKLGDGTQYMSWIAIDDLLSALLFAINHKKVEGIINLSAPHPITNATFTTSLSKLLHRPAWLPIPSFMLRLILGAEMAGELLLSSTRADSSRLESFGYKFLYPEINQTLIHLLSPIL